MKSFAEYAGKPLNEAANLDALSRKADLSMGISDYKAIISDPDKFFKKMSVDQMKEVLADINDDLSKVEEVADEEGYQDLRNLVRNSKKRYLEAANKRMNDVLTFLRNMANK